MRPNRITLTLAACGAAVLATWLLFPLDSVDPGFPEDMPPPAAGDASPGTQPTVANPSATSSAGPAATGEQLTPEQQALLLDPRVIEFEQRLEFQHQIREFFDQAETLSSDDRQQRAETLEQQITQFEQLGEVSAPEALMVKLALIQTTVTDETRQQQLADELIEQYRQAAQQREEAWLAKRDPQFETYKSREQQIVAEVMAMERIPGGLTRDQYLRQRLQQARVETMGE